LEHHDYGIFQDIPRNTFVIESVSTNDWEVSVLLVSLWSLIDKITNNGPKKEEKVNMKKNWITDFKTAAQIARTYKIVIFLDPGITTPLCGIAIDPNGDESQLWNPFPRSSRLSAWRHNKNNKNNKNNHNQSNNQNNNNQNNQNNNNN